MTIFVIFRVMNPVNMERVMRAQFPNDHYKISNDQWLVSARGTAKDVSDRLAISDGDTGAAIVFSMANYFGRAPTELWDWIRTKAEQPGA